MLDDYTGSFTNSEGTTFYYKNGKLHRLQDKPAVVDVMLNQFYLNGRRHRIGGPATEWLHTQNKNLCVFSVYGKILTRSTKLVLVQLI
jgi:hypothetical protein